MLFCQVFLPAPSNPSTQLTKGVTIELKSHATHSFVCTGKKLFFFLRSEISKRGEHPRLVRLFAHYPSLYKIYSLRSLKCQSYSPHCVTTIPLRRTLNETHDKKLLRHFYFFASFLPITFRVH